MNVCQTFRKAFDAMSCQYRRLFSWSFLAMFGGFVYKTSPFKARLTNTWGFKTNPFQKKVRYVLK